MANKNITYGNVELDSSELDPRHVKVRITTMVDEDVLSALKMMAAKKGQKYQTIINQVLKAFVERKKERKLEIVTEKRIRQIVREEIKRSA